MYTVIFIYIVIDYLSIVKKRNIVTFLLIKLTWFFQQTDVLARCGYWPRRSYFAGTTYSPLGKTPRHAPWKASNRSHFDRSRFQRTNMKLVKGLFPLSQHIEKSNSHIANILIFTHEWSAGYSLFSQVTECVMN